MKVSVQGAISSAAAACCKTNGELLFTSVCACRMQRTTGILMYLLSVKLPQGTLCAYSPVIFTSELVSLMTLAWTQRSFAAIFKGPRLVTVLPTLTTTGELICVCASCSVAFGREYAASDHHRQPTFRPSPPRTASLWLMCCRQLCLETFTLLSVQ